MEYDKNTVKFDLEANTNKALWSLSYQIDMVNSNNQLFQKGNFLGMPDLGESENEILLITYHMYNLSNLALKHGGIDYDKYHKNFQSSHTLTPELNKISDKCFNDCKESLEELLSKSNVIPFI